MKNSRPTTPKPFQVIQDYWELTKPGVTFMVVISTLGGFYLASNSGLDLILLMHTIFGSWLVAAGTNALNQLIERNIDARMKRTQNRPLPAGRLGVKQVRQFTLVISGAGILYLLFMVNWLTSLLAALTLLSYIFIYTPLKRKTHLSTFVGAVPGALPALGGWTAVTHSVSGEALILFAILFFWQLPHFLAIAWIYREDYRRGGFSVLPVVDPSGVRTGYYVISNCLALLTVSLMPSLVGLTGVIYLVGAMLLGVIFSLYGFQLMQNKSSRDAKKLLHASIIYLPLLMLLMFLDKS